MNPIRRIASRTVVLAVRDVDTDQIIPARYLTTTTREGLGQALFHDLRYDDNGNEVDAFPLNQARAAECKVLVAGKNFGCGSSREHAPWALLDYGFEAVISTEIADIFRSNALKNGLVPVIVDDATHAWLLDNPGADVVIDLESASLTLPDGSVVGFPIDAFARYCLLEGIDELGYLRKHLGRIEKFEESRVWKP
ncbi:MAG: 3-isopropylmalate dehydratase small subunit [Gammaproteobacteria bacterium]|nr:3-isopropylmalate dehydratase small subunit [Gammaproteobacteria bacterium]NNF48622.1 3-isopropylmalate dehydratase small subunit [Woeseiaceae bacterium]MBT8094180.1 3-isopropylmalate dehydratase small subunit [Gammaproteobacteria bacterium]MBT8105064.1 3-isopropylmalate dehydratase small subunit [Gammaproteobacteria bacterium]NNK25078.1 3-isopropylmalate dehydratase small subunit [Woeseiaceae bacterium]